jgi:3-oxochol-4-en-24-oyl-CoA dehydrogenase
MGVAMTADQRSLQQTIERWAQRSLVLDEVRRREPGAAGDGAEPVTSWAGLADLGVLAAGLPEELGGAGGDLLDAATVLEAAAGQLVPGPLLPVVLAAQLIATCAPAETAKALLADLVSGEAGAGVALDPGSLVAEPAGDGSFVVHGEASAVLGAAPGALLVLTARIGSGPDQLWFTVPAGRPAIRFSPAVALDFSRPLGTVRAEQVEVPAEHVLTGLTRDRAADLAATLIAAEMAGLVARCLEIATAYATIREQFGRPIGSFQAIKHLCANLLCQREEVAALAWDAARAAGDSCAQSSVAAAAAAAHVLDAGVQAAFTCIQVLGGIGFTWEHDAHLYLRRALANRQWIGGGQVWRERAAALALAGHRRVPADDQPDPLAQGAEGSAPSAELAALRADVQRVAAECAALSGPQRRAALAGAGLVAPHWPAPYGRSASVHQQVVIDAELRAAGIERPPLVIGGWAGATVLEHGTDEQRRRFVQPTLDGSITWCQLFSEPGAGSDLAALRTRAERVEGGWRLTGQKVWTSLATEADRAICLARTDPDVPKHRGISYFLVDMRTPGIEIRPLREITGDAVFNEVFLDDVFVPDEDLLGQPGDGWRMTRTTLAAERVAMAGGSMLGEPLEQLVSICAQQPAAAALLGSDRLGSLVSQASSVSLIAARIMAQQLEAAGRERPGGSSGTAGADGGIAASSAVLKLVGVRHRQDVSEAGFEVLGPGAIALDDPARAAAHELLLSRCLSIAGGTTQILLTVAAERILGLPREKSL